MPEIFEIFGYPLSDHSELASSVRHNAMCPFMGRACDGGGNRFLSNISLTKGTPLADYFTGRETVHAGVCSINVKGANWIVCPRRLLVLGRHEPGARDSQEAIEKFVLQLTGSVSGQNIGIWPELKIKYKELGSVNKTFDYAFDYVVMQVKNMKTRELAVLLGLNDKKTSAIFRKAGYEFTSLSGEEIIKGVPFGPPSIIEIMTSSTSGGDKNRRTTIPNSFEDAILGKHHKAPSINYRQVWARMVSQLIVKSEVAIAWRGKTFWLVQDTLIDYVRASTALDITQFESTTTSEVNMISLAYDSLSHDEGAVVDLDTIKLYSGPISANEHEESSVGFEDIIRAPVCPPYRFLLEKLAHRKPIYYKIP